MRHLPFLSGLLTAVAAFVLFSGEAQASLPQDKAHNPPPVLAPGKTATSHEIGASFNFSGGHFTPQFNWRGHFPSTGAQGVLSGLWLGAEAGPAIGYGGGVAGMLGVQLGYEFDPFSNLALTFSPLVHNDIYFANWFMFAQTYGMAMRLYIDKHWIVFVEPVCLGWDVGRWGGGFHHRSSFGFAFKF